jgi:hypothetical protein
VLVRILAQQCFVNPHLDCVLDLWRGDTEAGQWLG